MGGCDYLEYQHFKERNYTAVVERLHQANKFIRQYIDDLHEIPFDTSPQIAILEEFLANEAAQDDYDEKGR